MKYLFFLLISMIYITPVFSQKTEDEAIKKVIIGSTTAWANRDTTAYLASYADNELTHRAVNFSNLSIGVSNGFAVIQNSIREAMKSDAKPFYLPDVKRTNWLIKVLSPEWAWVNYTQKMKTIRGETYTSYETRLMHKEGGKWKINVVNALWDYKNVEMPAVNPDEEEIKAAIISETEIFRTGNLEAYMAHYAQVPYVLWSVTNGMDPGSVLTLHGYDAVKAMMASFPWFKNYDPNKVPTPSTSVTTRLDWNVQIRGNTAFVSFLEHNENPEKQTKNDVVNTRVLEKINGKWQFVMLSALMDFKNATPPIKGKY